MTKLEALLLFSDSTAALRAVWKVICPDRKPPKGAMLWSMYAFLVMGKQYSLAGEQYSLTIEYNKDTQRITTYSSDKYVDTFQLTDGKGCGDWLVKFLNEMNAAILTPEQEAHVLLLKQGMYE